MIRNAFVAPGQAGLLTPYIYIRTRVLYVAVALLTVLQKQVAIAVRTSECPKRANANIVNIGSRGVFFRVEQLCRRTDP